MSLTTWPKTVLYEGTGEWSALYVDGKLDTVGDHYLAAERINELFGVVVIQSDDFLLGNPNASRQDVAQTMDRVAHYNKSRADRQTQAAALREQAEALLEQAAELER
jgi:predicted trehalose synthase